MQLSYNYLIQSKAVEDKSAAAYMFLRLSLLERRAERQAVIHLAILLGMFWAVGFAAHELRLSPLRWAWWAIPNLYRVIRAMMQVEKLGGTLRSMDARYSRKWGPNWRN